MLDEGQHLRGEVFGAGEGAVAQQSACEDGEEALDLVEPGGVLGGKHEPPARVFVKPGVDLARFVGGEVVEDRDDLLAGGDLGFELLQEGQEVPAIARRGGHARDLPVMDVQRGEQVGGAVAHVLAVAAGGLAGGWKRVRAGGLARGDRGLLVDRDDDRVAGRVEVQSADLGRLGVEVGAQLAHHPVLGQVRTDVDGAQDHMCLGLRHANPLGQLGVRPTLATHALGGVGRTGAGQRDQLGADLRAVGQGTARLGPIAQPVQPAALKP